MVLFTSEYMVLLASIWGTGARYGVNCIDLRRARGREDAPAWEEKSMWMFYIDLAVGESLVFLFMTHPPHPSRCEVAPRSRFSLSGL